MAEIMEFELENRLREFMLKVLANTVDTPTEFDEIVSEHFWEMFEPIESLGLLESGSIGTALDC